MKDSEDIITVEVGGKTYTIILKISGNEEGDDIKFLPETDGATVTIEYMVADIGLNNRLEFGGVAQVIAPVTKAGSGERQYTMDPDDIIINSIIIIIYAAFTHNDDGENYTVRFDVNGGDETAAPAALTVREETPITLPDGPTRDGYGFDGWNTEVDGTGDPWAAGVLFIPETNITLYAQWERYVYTVTFDINGGTGTPPAEQLVDALMDITLPAGTGLSRSGYSFDGWNTEADGTGDPYVVGASFTPTGNVTLYVQWGVLYTVNYVTNGANSIASRSVAPGSTISNPGRPGGHWTYDSKLEGWYTNAALTARAAFPMTINGNTTLYAKWTNYELFEEAHGGIIYYRNPSGFTDYYWYGADVRYDNYPNVAQTLGDDCTYYYTAYYLVVCMEDACSWDSSKQDYVYTFPWTTRPGTPYTPVPNTGSAIGRGRANSSQAYNAEVNSPAYMSETEYAFGVMRYEFIPSADELNELYKVKTQVNNKIAELGYGDPIQSANYWTSTQSSSNTSLAGSRNMGNGAAGNNTKTSKMRVRCIDAF